MSDDYLRINLANWNSRVPHHERGYRLAEHLQPDHLSGVVSFDLPRLGDIAGLDARPSAVPHRHRHGLARQARAPG